MSKRNLKEYFKTKYTDEEIENHYKAVKYKNDLNKIKYKKIEEEHKEELEKAKQYFKKVKVSLKWDWFWCNNKYWRIFIYFYDLDNSIKIYNK